MSSSDIFISETIGTAVLILLGGGVCAAVTLKRSKAFEAGWVAIAFGWGFAVLTGAYIASKSGAHLNPAVTVGLAVKGGTPWGDVPVYFAGQLLGAMIGAVLVWLAYYGHFKAHLTDPEIVGEQSGPEGMVDRAAAPKAGPVLGVFSTGPEIRNAVQNLTTEVIATIVLVLAILTQASVTTARRRRHRRAADRVRGRRYRSVAGRPDRLRDQPGSRPRSAYRPLAASAAEQGRVGLGLRVIPVAGPLIGGAIAGGIYNLAFA